jgi:hypothetical protein
VADDLKFLSPYADVVIDVGADVGQPPQLGLSGPDMNSGVYLPVTVRLVGALM